jgi:hypothetical protein
MNKVFATVWVSGAMLIGVFVLLGLRLRCVLWFACHAWQSIGADRSVHHECDRCGARK